jgi:predicted transcriptional regulator
MMLQGPTPVSTMSEAGDSHHLLRNDRRRMIFNHVTSNPGHHLRKLQRQLDMPLGTLEYHLNRLARDGLLVTREQHRFKSFYPSHGMDRRDRDVLYFLRQEMPRRLALLIAQRPGIGFQELTRRMPISSSTVSFHLRKLVAGQIVQEHLRGRRKTYTIPDTDRVLGLIKRYRKSFVDDVVDRFMLAWMDVVPRQDER